MSRRILFALTALMFAAPLALEAQMDLHMRVDRSTSEADPDDVPDVSIEHLDGGAIRVGTGPAVVLWADDHMASGTYTLSGTFTLEEPSSHRNYYGFIYGGSDLAGPNQTYLYFLVAQDGSYIVKQRMGEMVHDIQGRTAHDAIATPGADGRSVNELEVRVGDSQTEFVVNGTVVHTVPNTGMAAGTNGIWGVRVNHVIPSLLISDVSFSN
jgi:hypothetical protein